MGAFDYAPVDCPEKVISPNIPYVTLGEIAAPTPFSSQIRGAMGVASLGAYHLRPSGRGDF